MIESLFMRSARFWSKVDVRKPGQCWEWKASVAPNGYGKFSIRNRPESAHVVAFTLFGRTIEQGKHIDHICRNRRCVNPYHLRAVTPRINAIENSDSCSALNSRKTQCRRGHELTESNVKMLVKRGRPTRRCKICLEREYQEKRAREHQKKYREQK
jgi:hypothetical protein